MKIITHNNQIWNSLDITDIRINLNTNIAQITFEDGHMETALVNQTELEHALRHILKSRTKRELDPDDCIHHCKTQICLTDVSQCPYMPRDRKEYEHDDCYYTNNHPRPMCRNCPRYERSVDACACFRPNCPLNKPDYDIFR